MATECGATYRQRMAQLSWSTLLPRSWRVHANKLASESSWGGWRRAILACLIGVTAQSCVFVGYLRNGIADGGRAEESSNIPSGKVFDVGGVEITLTPDNRSGVVFMGVLIPVIPLPMWVFTGRNRQEFQIDCRIDPKGSVFELPLAGIHLDMDGSPSVAAARLFFSDSDSIMVEETGLFQIVFPVAPPDSKSSFGLRMEGATLDGEPLDIPPFRFSSNAGWFFRAGFPVQ